MIKHLPKSFISKIPISNKRIHYSLLGLIITLTIISLNIHTGFHESVVNSINKNYNYYSSRPWIITPIVNKVSVYPATDSNIIFPRDFQYNTFEDLKSYYTHYFKPLTDKKDSDTNKKSNDNNKDKDQQWKDKQLTEAKTNHKHLDSQLNLFINENLFKYNGDPKALTPKIQSMDYKNHKLSMYDSINNINSDMKQCNSLSQDLAIDISNYTQFDDNLKEMVSVLINQLETDEVFKELKPFFKKDLINHAAKNEEWKHWFKFAGTSVWLEQYGVHFMISRALYSSIGSKKSPNLSLTYAQVFDEDWNELKNVELIIPTTNPVGNHEAVYKNLKFPSFLPIPFYHDSHYQKKRFYGPEDPRLMLIKNEDGIEEPLVIFNAYHRKLDQQLSVNEREMNITFNYYRSMFMAWPFQYQVGKLNVDGLGNRETDSKLYNKVVELRRENSARLEVQKNWTPFTSTQDRANNINLHDKYIYFIYRWSNLEILKCHLTKFNNFGESICSFHYRRSPKLNANADVGPLRGGTEMISLNDLLPSSHSSHSHHDQEIWIGFARAHIKGCGCGKDMYRPNLAVLIREDDQFKISQLSSFISFDIPVDGWSDPKIQCARKDPNALIPNGISSWVAKDTVGSNGKGNGIEDWLTLSLSVADASVHTVHIKNLLSSLIEHTSFMNFNKTLGYTNDIVDCSLKSSVNFCSVYGDEQKKLGKTPK